MSLYLLIRLKHQKILHFVCTWNVIGKRLTMAEEIKVMRIHMEMDVYGSSAHLVLTSDSRTNTAKGLKIM